MSASEIQSLMTTGWFAPSGLMSWNPPHDVQHQYTQKDSVGTDRLRRDLHTIPI